VSLMRAVARAADHLVQMVDALQAAGMDLL